MKTNHTLKIVFGNLLFTILQPGIVAGLIPYLILNKNRRLELNLPFLWNQYLGTFLFISGIFILTICIVDFIKLGKGTLSPILPTKKLVCQGLYKYTRNPMYIGVILILVGEVLFFKAPLLTIYTMIVYLIFNIFIVYKEEPRLSKDFGTDYQRYRNKVKRWI